MRISTAPGRFFPALAGVALLSSVVAVAVLGSVGSVAAALPDADETQLVSSVDTNPQGGAGAEATAPSVSANGRFVVFVSASTTLSSDDPHGHPQVYEYDANSDTTRLVSVSRTGAHDGANDASFDPTVSADGRFVAFSSRATDLVAAATGGYAQVYVADLTNGTTRLVSATSAAVGADNDSLKPAISADGSTVVFTSQATDLSSVPTDGYVQAYRRVLGSSTELVSLESTGTRGGNGDVSAGLSVSADGREVAFASQATNLTAEATGVHTQVFLRDTATERTQMVSLNMAATGGADNDSAYPVVSADGSVVAFSSLAGNLTASPTHSHVQVYARQLDPGTTALISRSNDGTMSGGNGDSGGTSGVAISSDGSKVVFSSLATDLAGASAHAQVFEAIVPSGVVSLVSSRFGSATPGDGDSAFPSMSGDGGVVVFISNATNLTASGLTGDFNVFGLFGDTPRLISHNAAVSVFGDDRSGAPAISADGHYVVFESQATNLTNHDSKGFSQIYRRDLLTGATTLVSIGTTGAGANGSSEHPSISADGRYVAFDSDASDLAPVRPTGYKQVWLRDMAMSTGAVTLVSSSDPATPLAGDADSVLPMVSGSGNAVVFVSTASHLTSQTANTHAQVYEWAASSHAIELVSIDRTQSSVGDSDSMGAPAVSSDGDFVAFASNATNLGTIDTHSATQVYVRQLSVKSTQLVSVTTSGTAPPQGAAYPAISADGVHIAFASGSAALTTDDPKGHAQAYSRDIVQRKTTLVSVSRTGEAGDADVAASTLSVSGDGSRVAFASAATNLVPGSTSHLAQIFVRTIPTATTAIVSTMNGQPGSVGNGISFTPVISSDGRIVAFASVATNLIDLPPSTNEQVYAHRVPESISPTSPPPTNPPTTPNPTATGGSGSAGGGGIGSTSGTGSATGSGTPTEAGSSHLAATGRDSVSVWVSLAFGALAVASGSAILLRRASRRAIARR